MSLFVPRDRKSLFRQFLAGMYDAVVITDPNGHILEINLRAEEHFGRVQEEVVDKPISFFIPGLEPSIVERIRRGLEDDRHMMIDASGVNRKGEKFACEVTVSIIDLMEPGDLVFTIRNVERRRMVRDSLRAKEAAFEIAPAALFCCSRDGDFTEVNDEFLELFGLDSADEARKRSFAEFFTEPELKSNFARALEGERTGAEAAAESDGGGKFKVTLAPNRQGRKIVGVVGSVTKS